MQRTIRALILLAVATLLWLPAPPPAAGAADGGYRLSSGQTVYVPAYSNVFSGPRARPFNLAAMLSIRNTDLQQGLQITAIDYYDSNGKLLRRHLAKPQSLAPLASTYVYLEEKDTSGGFGANFIVRWKAGKEINAPIIECVMIGAESGQGISFVSPGQVIRE